LFAAIEKSPAKRAATQGSSPVLSASSSLRAFTKARLLLAGAHFHCCLLFFVAPASLRVFGVFTGAQKITGTEVIATTKTIKKVAA
jgi:hypothetical protein